MIGVIANVIAVVLGSAIGLLFKKGIPKKVSDGIMTGIGLCIIGIGIKGVFDGNNILVTIISMVLGAVVGFLLDIDKRLNDSIEGITLKDGCITINDEKIVAISDMKLRGVHNIENLMATFKNVH